MIFTSTDPVEQFLIEVHSLRDRDGRLAAYRLGEDIEDEIRIARILVAKISAMEREACAKVCEAQKLRYEERAAEPEEFRDINPEVAQIAGMTCDFNAAAIRARGSDV